MNKQELINRLETESCMMRLSYLIPGVLKEMGINGVIAIQNTEYNLKRKDEILRELKGLK